MGKLAINGGEKTVKSNVDVRLPVVSEKGIAAAVELMRKGEISTSPLVDVFEKEFAQFIGVKYGLASNSGTSSLHQALFAVGVSAGDEVIVPSFTFVASVSTILAARGIPVFCDVDIDTHCIDPEDIERKITSRTRAIMVVHVWGNPCDMDSILRIAHKHKLAVVEDCSHAHGAVWKGKKVGSIGDAGGFSLQGSKIMPAGEGGVLTTNNLDVYERAIVCGRVEKIDSIPAGSRNRKASMGLGFKHRPHPVGIAIALEHLRELDVLNGIRNKNGRYLDDAISDIPCVKPQKVLPGCERVYSYHFGNYDRNLLGGVSLEVFLRALAAEGVGCGRVGYGRLHETDIFEEGSIYFHECCLGRCPHSRRPGEFEKPDLPNTLKLRSSAFTMAPRFETNFAEKLDQYVDAYHKVASCVDELKAYEKDNADKIKPVNVSARSVNPV
ncbi:MAG TPA: DegT/DnrJ/EryC1/StrS family aminotransferase [bacterium]|nr:DegT/DnrJ/EryC1/StrS family aminotransferase [bacterium]